MAVKHVETFTFELPIEVVDPGDETVAVTMSRGQLEQLTVDLMHALGIGSGQRASVDMFPQEYVDSGQPFESEPPVGTQRLSVEEAAAQQQILATQAARRSHTANPHQPRGSAIGTQDHN